jgi:uncharacterized protein (TIGR02001 family)
MTAGFRAAGIASRRRRALGAVLPVCLALAPPGLARAEVAVSASLASDYRYRGVSLSDEKPALTLTVTYDHASGAYVGVSSIGALSARGAPRWLGYQAYVGYAHRVGPEASWDVGLTATDVAQYGASRSRVRYGEVYGGLSWKSLSAHVYYAPDYLGQGASALYTDVDGAIRPAKHWRLFGHVGLATPLESATARRAIRRASYDLKAGVAASVKNLEVQLAWSEYGPSAEYFTGERQPRDALVVSATYSF